MNSQPITDMLSHLDEIKDAIAILKFVRSGEANQSFQKDIDSRVEILEHEQKDVEYMLVQEYNTMDIMQVFTDLRKS